jgi:hypothetical protein
MPDDFTLKDWRAWLGEMSVAEAARLTHELFFAARALGERLRDAPSWHELRAADQIAVLESSEGQSILRKMRASAVLREG